MFELDAPSFGDMLGERGLYAGDAGLYAGDLDPAPALYAGLAGLYRGLVGVGEYDGLVGWYVGDVCSYNENDQPVASQSDQAAYG